jgi:hypothetical protein
MFQIVYFFPCTQPTSCPSSFQELKYPSFSEFLLVSECFELQQLGDQSTPKFLLKMQNTVNLHLDSGFTNVFTSSFQHTFSQYYIHFHQSLNRIALGAVQATKDILPDVDVPLVKLIGAKIVIYLGHH